MVRRLWAVVGCGSMVRVVGPTIVSFDFGLWVVVRQSWVMVRWSDGRGWWQRWSDGRRLCSDGHGSWVQRSDGRSFGYCRSWVIDLLVQVFISLLVKGCESNLEVVEWWVVGLGHNWSWCSRLV